MKQKIKDSRTFPSEQSFSSNQKSKKSRNSLTVHFVEPADYTAKKIEGENFGERKIQNLREMLTF